MDCYYVVGHSKSLSALYLVLVKSFFFSYSISYLSPTLLYWIDRRRRRQVQNRQKLRVTHYIMTIHDSKLHHCNHTNTPRLQTGYTHDMY